MSSLTPYLDVPLAQLAAAVQSGAVELSFEELDAVVGEHALDVEATGTRPGLLAAAEALHDLASWAEEREEQRAAHRWEVLAEHLTDRAARSDPIGVEALLRSDNGKPARVLELLAAAPGGSIPRSELSGLLVASESHVSHILRALHDAGLIHRHQAGRHVQVTIAARGREVLGTPAPEPSTATLSLLMDGLPPDLRFEVEHRPSMTPAFATPA